MVPNTGIKASTPRDEIHPQKMTATCFLFSQQIKCGACFLSLFLHIGILRSFFITAIVLSEENNFFSVFYCPISLLLTKNHSFRLAGLIKLFFLNTLFLDPFLLQ